PTTYKRVGSYFVGRNGLDGRGADGQSIVVLAREPQRDPPFNRFAPGVFRISEMRGWILSLDKTISTARNFLAVSEFASELLDERPNRGMSRRFRTCSGR